MFWIRVRAEDDYGVAVVELHGELDITGALPVRGLLTTLAAHEQVTIVDLAGLSFMDCTGLGALIRGRRYAGRAGHSLLLAAPAGPVKQVLELSGATGLFSTHSSVAAAAVAAAESERSAPAPTATAAPAPHATAPRTAGLPASAPVVTAPRAAAALTPAPDHVRANNPGLAPGYPVTGSQTDRIWRLITGHATSRIKQLSPSVGRLPVGRLPVGRLLASRLLASRLCTRPFALREDR